MLLSAQQWLSISRSLGALVPEMHFLAVAVGHGIFGIKQGNGKEPEHGGLSGV